MAQNVAHFMASICKPLAWLFKTEPPEIVNIPERYLVLTKRIMEQAQRTASGPSPKFNHGQCKYLADKLRAAVDGAQEFLQLLKRRYKTSLTSKDMAEFLGIFKLLHAMAKEAEGFIQACCKDAWIPAAVKLTNMSEHVSSIGFNLELCARVFESEGKEWGGIESLLLRPILVDDVRSFEAKVVEEKASLDKDALLANVKAFCDQSSKENPQLTLYLHKRLHKRQGLIGEEFCETDMSSVTQTPESLGRGSFASVLKGWWEGVPVAMKVTEDGFAKFKYEVAIQSRLCHPNIASLYCYGNETLVMELMVEDLFSLIQRLRRKHDHGFPFSILVSVDIMLQLGEGMRYLHEMKIVHRDLKSKNILVRPVENASGSEYVLVKVADFGEAKRIPENDIVDMTSNKGTLRWKAPEMIKKEDNEVRCAHPNKCDMYSFAMVCYEIMSGKQPFSDTNECEIKRTILDGGRPDLPNRCPNQLKALIERCWSAHPSKRPCFDEICAELRHVKYVLLMTSLWGRVSRLAHEPSPNWYHSAHIQRMMESRGEFSNKGENETESSEVSWSTLEDPLSQAEDVQDLNRRYFEDVKSRQTQEPGFFRDMDDLVLGDKIAEGALMEVFRAGRRFVVKIFKAGTRGEELERMWSPGMLNAFDRGGPRRAPLSSVHGVTLLTDERFLGRFAIVQSMHWGDLGKLIVQRMMLSHNQGPPFTVDEAFTLMFGIAKDMASLHSESPPILHRDLKASNVLLQECPHSSLKVTVSDFECSQGVAGTGFWRAPEVLQQLKDRRPFSSLVCTDMGDVFSYGMTCFEIVTGRIPFGGHPRNDFDIVLNGERPELPRDLDPILNDLIQRCWQPDPLQRPSFDDIVKELSFRCITEA